MEIFDLYWSLKRLIHTLESGNSAITINLYYTNVAEWECYCYCFCIYHCFSNSSHCHCHCHSLSLSLSQFVIVIVTVSLETRNSLSLSVNPTVFFVAPVPADTTFDKTFDIVTLVMPVIYWS